MWLAVVWRRLIDIVGRHRWTAIFLEIISAIDIVVFERISKHEAAGTDMARPLVTCANNYFVLIVDKFGRK